MSAWIIYDKNGLTKCEARKLEYNGEFLGACSVSVSVSAPTPIGFSIGDWLEYRGERFELNYDPSVVKESSLGGYGEGFVYENVVFNSLSDELTRCDFLDVVPADNGMHYSSLPTFSFFAENIYALVERIQANLDRVYKADKAWTLRIHPEYASDKNANISASNLTCWDALALVHSIFGANFTIKGRTITIGTSGIAVGNLFSYGKGNGLYSIERNAESNQKIVTRLRAYGSTRNMPTGYYRNIEGGNVPNNMAVTHLMLPSFPTSTLDPYIDSKNLAELGVREGTVFFDGSGDLEEIYPTMEGITAEDLKSAGINVDSEGFLDEVVSAEQIADDGITPKEGEIPATFTITIKDVGFDINEHLSTSGNATISMKNGMCGGREFEIVECNKEESNYVLTCNRVEDTGLGLYFPYKDYQINEGDKFVLLNLEMPDVYIKAASQRLLSAATEYLAKNDYVRYSFTPRVDNIMLAKQHDEAVKYGLVSIHDTIKEGDFILFEDNDLGVSGSITIDALSIKENAEESLIPEYEITLKEEKTVGTIEKIQNQISSILNGSTGAGGIGGGVTNEQVKSILEAIGGKMFLSKQKDDKTPFSLGVGKNLSVGEDLEVKGSASIQEGLSIGGNIESKDFAEGTEKGGYAIRKNSEEQYEVESDNIIARILAKTYDLLVQNHATFVGDLSSEEFISGFIGGKGWSIRTKEILNAAGINEKKSVAEFDDLIVRGSMRIYEFIVSQLLGENDNRIFTGMMEVDHYDANDGKVYLKTDNGRLYNPFRVDDVIIVQQYGGNPSEENGYYVIKQYEFIVTEVGVGEQGEDRLDWVRFRNFTTSMEGGNEELITEHDTLVRIDNISDANRKGIIQLMSVGEDTPYMDFIYGAKTDPENSLKGRLGNLGGVYNPLFGWLKEFGAYLTNLYAVGEFVIAHTGENVSDSIEIAKGQFRTNYRQTTYDMSEEQNFFTNASMTNNCEHWVLGSDATEYFMVDELPQFFNFDLYASEQTYAGLSEWKGRDMLRLSKSSIMQANSLIDKAGTHKVYTGSVENDDGSYTDTYEEVADTLYLSVRFFVSVSGKLEFGFVENGKFIDNSFHYSSNVTAREDGYEVKLSGIWDGKGDFTITSTGDVYVDLLSLTDKPLDNFKITTETKIEQDATRISLLGKKINGVEGSVTDLGIELNAAEERITAYVNKEIQGVESSVSSLEVSVKGIRTTVASVQGTATDAKNLANTAQKAANDAASKALAAQTTANSANSKADANATAIAQTESSISLLASAFTLKDGKYVLTSAAGAVITSEVASIYATKSNVNSLGERVSTAESRITTTANSISALTSKITFDSNGNITNINKSGLMVESNFASLFTTQVTSQGVAKTAEIKTYVDDSISKIKISADQIDMSANDYISIINKGTTTISASRVDLSGLVTVTSLNSTLTGYATYGELSAAQTALNKSISNLNTTLSTKIDAKVSTESLNTKVSELNTAIRKKADTSSLGSVAYMNDIANAACNGSTLIVGGYINADLLKVEKIYADEGTVGGFSIGENSLSNTEGDYITTIYSGVSSLIDIKYGNSVIFGISRNSDADSENFKTGRLDLYSRSSTGLMGKSTELIAGEVKSRYIGSAYNLSGNYFSLISGKNGLQIGTGVSSSIIRLGYDSSYSSWVLCNTSWPTKSTNVPIGGVYLDGTTLRVRTS